MKVSVDIFGQLVDVEIHEKDQLMKDDVRYLGTDFIAGVDIYEVRETGEFVGCRSHS